MHGSNPLVSPDVISNAAPGCSYDYPYVEDVRNRESTSYRFSSPKIERIVWTRYIGYLIRGSRSAIENATHAHALW